ncbi:hypothetical protein [Dyella agri]|uniref:Uncharacterized protein n=1 Tax=Dyella agri TaxID=1926869 RepID=A0ABW8KCT2_9GAMM
MAPRKALAIQFVPGFSDGATGKAGVTVSASFASGLDMRSALCSRDIRRAYQTRTTRSIQAKDRGKQEKLATVEQVNPSPLSAKSPDELPRPGFF